MRSERKFIMLAGCAAVGLIFAGPAVAQGVAPQLAPGAGSLIIDQDRPDRQIPTPPAASAAPQPAQTTQTGGQSAPAVLLKEVRLAGATRLAPRIGAITARFVGHPMDAATVKGAADALSAAYADTGLALYTVAVPKQDLSHGVLTLFVVEGYIGEATIDGDARARKNRLIQAYVARLKAERPLTKRRLERYLSLIRDIPGIKVDAQLYNTPTPGAVRLALKVQIKHLDPDLAINNSGTPRLGAVQATAAITVNGLFRDGDLAKLTGSAPTDFDRFQYVGGTYVTPIGADGLTLRTDASYLRTRPDNPPIDGDAASLGFQLAYPLIRGYDRNLSISGGLDGLNSDNALYGTSLTSDHTRAARLGLSYGDTQPKRTVSAGVILSQGLDALGARADTRITDANFEKLTAQVGINQQLGKTLVLRLRGLVQASTGRLPAAEQLPLGGPTFGRAFPQAEIVGDYGYAGSAELGWIQPKPWPKVLKGSELYGFGDLGRTYLRDRLPFEAAARYELASAGFGVRFLIHQKSVIGLEAAKAVEAPYANQSRPWRVIVSWKLAH